MLARVLHKQGWTFSGLGRAAGVSNVNMRRAVIGITYQWVPF